MKKYFIIILTLILLLSALSSCGGKETADDPSERYSSEYVYVSETIPENTVGEEPSEESTSMPVTEPTSAQPYTAVTETTTYAPSVSVPVTSAPETTAVQPTTETPGTTAAPETTAAPVTQESTSVDLTVELPDANGKMEVDTSPRNKFTSAVSEKRGIDSSLLAAVYAVPASGQNYVLEFTKTDSRAKNDLRRVYLLDDNCNITSVAAAKSTEKENISSTENWFCFNVLIKGVIFDAIADKL